MRDFLHAIFSRGNQAATNDPVVSFGGVSSNSASLTYDVAHFDSTGNLLVSVVGSVAGGTSTVAGAVSQSGTWTVQSIWVQRLDATNDAVTVYQNVSNSNWSVIASQSGAWTVTGVLSSINLGQARTTDPVAAANAANTAMITDSLGKLVVLPGAVGDQFVGGTAQVAGVAAQPLIATPGAGRRIAVQSLGFLVSASEALNIILSGGPTNRTFGPFVPTGGISLNAGGAPLYITSASTNLSVAGSITASFGAFASGYAMSN
jgi:hypothetical protein